MFTLAPSQKDVQLATKLGNDIASPMARELFE
jgi:hypothetical protein